MKNSSPSLLLYTPSGLFLMLFCLLAASPAVIAEDDLSLAALRAWIDQEPPAADAITPGQHLSVNDRSALIEPLIPRAAWPYYIFDDMDMEVAPTQSYPPPAGWNGSEMDTDYSLDEQGVLLGFSGGGFPFPDIDADDPYAAQKVIWNMLWRPGQDDYDMPMVTWLRSENGKLDRKLEYTSVSSTYALGEQCLVDGYEEVKSKRIMEFRSPRDMAGAKDMSIAYVDHYKEDSGWMYLPAQRKPRRTLASERTSELMGMDMIREDLNGFGGKVFENNWTYLGRRKLLAMNNIVDNPEFGGPHLWVPHKARWEIRDTHVLLIEPKSSNHPYSARIVFIDAETYWTHWMFGFDRSDNRMMRMNQHYLKYSESYAEEEPQQAPYIEQDFSKNLGHHVFLHLGETDINAKKPHATTTHCYVKKRVFSAARARQFYSLRNMISGRR